MHVSKYITNPGAECKQKPHHIVEPHDHKNPSQFIHYALSYYDYIASEHLSPANNMCSYENDDADEMTQTTWAKNNNWKIIEIFN